MFRPIDIAAGLERVAEVLSDRRLDPAVLPKLMYYAQGITLAESGQPLFAGGFEAWTHGPVEPEFRTFIDRHGLGWTDELRKIRPQIDDHSLELLRDVWHVFGKWSACELSEATHAEGPWLRAREGLAWDHPSRPAIDNAWIHDFFADVIETGEDLMADLGISPEPDAPRWRRPFELGVNLKRLSGHPLLDDRQSRNLRVRMGYGEFPEDWSNINLGEHGLGLGDIRAMLGDN